MSDPARKLLTRDEAIAMLGVSKREFNRTAAKEIPYIRITNRIIRYRPSDVHDWKSARERRLAKEAKPKPSRRELKVRHGTAMRRLYLEAEKALRIRAGLPEPFNPISVLLVGECVPWHGKLSRAGYGNHRRAYEKARGPIPAGMHLDHLCRNRWCVNPDHLEPVTPQENQLRKPSSVRARTGLCARCGDPVTYRNKGTRCPTCRRGKERSRSANG